MSHPFQTASDVKRCPQCGCLLPAHYGSCPSIDEEMKATLAAIDAEAAERRARDGERQQERDQRDRARNVQIVRDALDKFAAGESDRVSTAVRTIIDAASEQGLDKLRQMLK